MENQEKITPSTTPKKKPKWLKALESQSWQAELVISGLAIFGSLQLPSFLNGIVDYCLYNFSEDYMDIFSFLFIYPYFTAAILIFSFIGHLILRAVWIGMLGLVSVYPNGINRDQDFFSKDYMEKFFKVYPDVNQFNKSLDDLCSSIFAASASIAIVMLMISFSISIILVIATIITFFIPSLSIISIVAVMGGILFLFSMLASALNSKSLRDKEWVKKIHFPYTQLFGKIVYLFAMKPITYISMIFMTNSKGGSFYSMNFLAGLFTFLFATFTVFPLLKQSNVDYFQQRYFFSYRTNNYHMKSTHYEDQLNDNSFLISPIIPSDIIQGKAIKLFIPWFHREKAYAESLCGEFIADDDMSKTEQRIAKAKFEVECRQQYYEIYLNDIKINNLKYYQHHYAYHDVFGYITYIPTDNCQPFENILTIKSHYTNDEGKIREIQIPFIFEKY